jgi:hypothetical protein
MDITEQAMIHRTEAKRLLGQFVIDQAVADRIVDSIICAAMLEMTDAMCSPRNPKEQPHVG